LPLAQFTLYFITVFFFLVRVLFLVKVLLLNCCKFDAKDFYLRYEFHLKVYQLLLCLTYGFFLMEWMGFVMSLYVVLHHSEAGRRRCLMLRLSVAKMRVTRRSVAFLG
jgi:hypothetical protein